MGLKIKANDDRVRGAVTAILLLGRERLRRGDADPAYVIVEKVLSPGDDGPLEYTTSSPRIHRLLGV